MSCRENDFVAGDCSRAAIVDLCRSQGTAAMTMTSDDLNVLRTARMHRVMNKLKSVSVSKAGTHSMQNVNQSIIYSNQTTYSRFDK